MLLTKIKETIGKYSLLGPGDRVVVAVSGGPDSVCLLAALRELSSELGISLHVAHLDHRFRGRESAAEARFVERLAQKLGIPSTIEEFDVPAYCRAHGLSAQAGAREVRYAFLERVMRSAGASRIAAGHTATDQAETFLLRLLRGAGVSGLAAIPPRRDAVIRPLLEVTREELMAYVKANELEYVSDPSNTKPLYTRNRIRMDVLPVLRRFNPRIIETLAAEAALLRGEDDFLETHARAVAAGIFEQTEDGIMVKRAAFNALHPALKRRLLRQIAGLAGVAVQGLSSVQVDEALAFMRNAQTGRNMLLPRGLSVLREYDRFIVRARTTVDAFSRTLAVPGRTAVPELGLEAEVALSPDGPGGKGNSNYQWQAAFDYDKMGTSLTLRNRRPGDRFCPSGMGGRHKKLQDFLVDEKVPRRRRDLVPLLVEGENILWVAGLRTDERFLPGPETKRVVFVGLKEG
jgi:tRNA(Ile)-lysidine synthase